MLHPAVSRRAWAIFDRGGGTHCARGRCDATRHGRTPGPALASRGDARTSRARSSGCSTAVASRSTARRLGTFGSSIHDVCAYARPGSLGFGDAYVDGWWIRTPPGRLERLILHGADRRSGRKLRRVLPRVIGSGTCRTVLAAGPWVDATTTWRRPVSAMLGARLSTAAPIGPRPRPRRRATGQARSRLPQAGAGARHARARHRLRLGRSAQLCGGALRRTRCRRDRVAGAGRDGRERCSGLPVEIRCRLPRLDERFDRIFSIGMFEHVGVATTRRTSRPPTVPRRDGLFLLHTIGAQTGCDTPDP